MTFKETLLVHWRCCKKCLQHSHAKHGPRDGNSPRCDVAISTWLSNHINNLNVESSWPLKRPLLWIAERSCQREENFVEFRRRENLKTA